MAEFISFQQSSEYTIRVDSIESVIEQNGKSQVTFIRGDTQNTVVLTNVAPIDFISQIDSKVIKPLS